MAEIELKSVRDLLKERFFVPDYQRGYRWGRQQVVDLLEDISEFIESDEFADGFYCLDLPGLRRSDDLYIKMNARGKPLTTLAGNSPEAHCRARPLSTAAEQNEGLRTRRRCWSEILSVLEALRRKSQV